MIGLMNKTFLLKGSEEEFDEIDIDLDQILDIEKECKQKDFLLVSVWRYDTMLND